jgi:mRNA interferase MazF
MKVERYGIYWANLDPTVGSEINKTRPVVVVSDDMMNSNLKTIVACPLTTSLHPTWRSRIQIAVQGKRNEIAVDQIRTLSKDRLIRRIARLAPPDALRLRRLISEMYGESPRQDLGLGAERSQSTPDT